MTTIGLDIATRTGWAVLGDAGERIGSGVWDCSVQPGEGAGMRYLRLRQHLADLIDQHPDATVYYERSLNQRSARSAEVAGGLVGTMQAFLEAIAHGRYAPAHFGSVKKYATDKGNASKAEMMAAAALRWGHEPEDDNEADALWVAAYGREVIGL